MADIVIIDYGMGNVHSVFKALDKRAKINYSERSQRRVY